MSHLGRARRGRRTALVAVGALFAFQALGVLGARVASAATCSFDGAVLTIDLASNEDVTVALAADGDTIQLGACSAGGATVSSTLAIVVNGGGGNNTVTIDMGNGVFTGIVWSLHGGGGDDNLVVTAGAGDDVVDVGASGVDLDGDGAIDIASLASLPAGSGVLTINGGGGGDVLTAYGSRVTGGPYAKAVVINGGIGNDDIGGGSAADSLDGGDASDTVDYLGLNAPVSVNLTTLTVSGGGGADAIANFENVVGSGGNDTLTGYLGPTDIAGGPGNDTIDCVVGDQAGSVDFFDSKNRVIVSVAAGRATGDGTDRFTNCESVVGSVNNDTIRGDRSTNDLEGGGGNDVLAGLGGNDSLAGLGGSDWVDYSWANNPAAVSLNCKGNSGTGRVTGGADTTTDVIGTMENAVLTSGDDSFTGNEFANTVRPNGGQNSLDGDGDAAVCGGTPVAPSGGDTLDYSIGYDKGVTINMAGGATGADSAHGFENVTGTEFADNITGDGGSNTVKGGKGNDNVKAGGGDDTVNLGPGNDTGRASSGDDDLFGRKGSDHLLGGGGDDLGKGGPGEDVCKGIEVATSCGTARRPR